MRQKLAATALVIIGVLAGWGSHFIDAHPAIGNFIDKEVIVIRALGFACGVERWPVKTLDDNAAAGITWTPHLTNIATLTALASTGEGARQPGTESTVWQLTGTRIIAFKQEADSDIHLELQSPAGKTMIAEMPLQSCVTANSNPAVAAQQQLVGAARAAFQNYLLAHGIQITGSYQAVSILTTLTGVGFFDFLHGQRGVAPNGIELHPVLSFKAA